MNLYDILGIPPTASAAQIKSAYRKRARETHPDAGGDGDEFALVSRAYTILMDPDARKRFDETGSIDDGPAPLTVRQRMIQIIVELFNGGLAAAHQHGMSLRHFNLVKGMREQVANTTKLIRDNAAKQRQALSDRQFMLKRITRKGDGQNLFADIIRDQIKQLEPVVKQAELDVLAVEMAADELLHYDNEVDLIQAVQMMQYGGNFTNQNMTSFTVWVR